MVMITTPLLRNIEHRLIRLEAKASKKLAQLDDFIKKKPILRSIFLPEVQEEIIQMHSFVNEKLIKAIMPSIIASEKNRAAVLDSCYKTMGGFKP